MRAPQQASHRGPGPSGRGSPGDPRPLQSQRRRPPPRRRPLAHWQCEERRRRSGHCRRRPRHWERRQVLPSLSLRMGGMVVTCQPGAQTCSPSSSRALTGEAQQVKGQEALPRAQRHRAGQQPARISPLIVEHSQRCPLLSQGDLQASEGSGHAGGNSRSSSIYSSSRRCLMPPRGRGHGPSEARRDSLRSRMRVGKHGSPERRLLPAYLKGCLEGHGKLRGVAAGLGSGVRSSRSAISSGGATGSRCRPPSPPSPPTAPCDEVRVARRRHVPLLAVGDGRQQHHLRGVGAEEGVDKGRGGGSSSSSLTSGTVSASSKAARRPADAATLPKKPAVAAAAPAAASEAAAAVVGSS